MSILESQKINVISISNVVLEPYLEGEVELVFGEKGYLVDLKEVDLADIYNNEELSLSSDLVVVIIDFCSKYDIWTVDKDEVFRDLKNIYDRIKTLCDSFVVFFGLEQYSSKSKLYEGYLYSRNKIIYYVNDKMSEYIQKSDLFVDFGGIIAEIGVDNAYDLKNMLRWNSPYSKALISKIASEICKQYLIHCGVTKKCLIVDCDNVLWGGILSEDGASGIVLSSSGEGKCFHMFQRFLVELYKRGVIIAICSKNDYFDVLKVFKEHSGMILKEDNIAVFQVNWLKKTDNIFKISQNLNLGLDSIVFVDDSDFELNLVKQTYPEITTIKYSFSTIFEELSCFNLRNDVDSAVVKERMMAYKTNELREELKLNCQNYNEYLESLNMKLDIHTIKETELARVSELTQRANKCTNGKRYRLEQLRAISSDDEYSIFSVHLEDKFSNLGLVGAFGIKNDSLVFFSLSCRALGRKVEKMIWDYIEKKYNIVNYEFIETGRNEEFHLFLVSKLGI